MYHLYKRAVTAVLAGALLLTAMPASAEPQDNTRGDVSGDGKVTVTDISKTAAHVKTVKMLSGESLTQADANFDGKVNVTDISVIAAHVKGVKNLPSDPNSADESFDGYDAYLIFADSEMNWGNWNGQGHHGVPSYGIDADVTADGEYTVSITNESVAALDDVGMNESLKYITYFDGEEKSLAAAEGCTMMCVDITGLLDGTLGADGSELEGFLEEGSDANVNKRVKGKYKGDEITVELCSINVDGERDIFFDPDKVKYGNLDEEDNCYRIEIANLLTGTEEDAAIDVNDLYFYDSLSITFRITGLS